MSKLRSQSSYLDNRPLMEKFREVYKNKPKVARYSNYGRGFCLTLGLSHLFLSLRFLIPYAFKDYDPWTIYYIKVFDCFLCINMFANFFCIMLYDTSVVKTKDRPLPRYSDNFPAVFGSGAPSENQNHFSDHLKSRMPGDQDTCVVGISLDDREQTPVDRDYHSSRMTHGLSWKQTENGNHLATNLEEREDAGSRKKNYLGDREVQISRKKQWENCNIGTGDKQGQTSRNKHTLTWHHCQKCNVATPPRAHHCDVCNKCILKRDHHCYVVGCCIGFRNQRYFVVFVFYTMVNAGFGLYLTWVYLRDHLWASGGWTDLLWPVAIYKTLVGTMSSVHCILVVHLPLLTFVAPVSFMYFSSQLTLITQGITLFEMAKNVPVKSSLGVDKHLRSVFGDFWVVNFFLPGQLLFRQMEDGCSWDGIKLAKP